MEVSWRGSGFASRRLFCSPALANADDDHRPRAVARHAVDAACARVPRHRRAGLPPRDGEASPRPRRAAPRSNRPASPADAARAAAHRGRARPRRDGARQHRLPGAPDARPRHLQRDELGRMGARRRSGSRCPVRATSSPRRAASATPSSTSRNRDCTTPTPTADDPCPAKTATVRNLVALGIDPTPDPGHLLLRGEKPGVEYQRQDGAPHVHRR